MADLVVLVYCDQGIRMRRRRHATRVQDARENLPVIDPQHKIFEPERDQRVRHRGAQFCLHDRRCRSEGVDIALVELAEAAARGTVRAPDRLDLIALEQTGHSGLMLCHDTRQRHRQVVPQRQIGLSGFLVIAALEDLENELAALVAVLPKQRLEVLDGGVSSGSNPYRS